jgi:hypothetical protein
MVTFRENWTGARGIQTNVVNQLRFDADPDPTFHFDADLDSIRILLQVYSCWKMGKFLTFIHMTASLYCFIFLVSAIAVKIFNILDSVLKFDVKKYL